jgi:formylglycine-generating enzyme required for sulfatase activity
MGSPKNEPHHTRDESQVDVVFTDGFWLSKYEITQLQWRTLMRDAPWFVDASVKRGSDYPATNIDFRSALNFCDKFTQQEHDAGRLPSEWEFRLPTEAQWEYACRAGSITAYAFGNDESKLADYAWCYANTISVGERFAHEVGKKLPNAWGLHDMHGNVWEWCLDVHQEKLPGGIDPLVTHPALLANRVKRGGWWAARGFVCRSACRAFDAPATRSDELGFRLALVRSDNCDCSANGRGEER